jgi:DNA ligase 1
MEYKKIAEIYENLQKNSKRLMKTQILADFIKEINPKHIRETINLLQGYIEINGQSKQLGVSSQTVIKAMCTSFGSNPTKINQLWKKKGDLGKVAKELTTSKQQATLFSINLDVHKVYSNLIKIAELEGEGAVNKKVQLISQLLTSAKPLESKYLVKTILEELRVGIATGTLRDALVWAYFKEEIGITYNEKENKVIYENTEKLKEILQKIQHAYDLTNDFALIIKTVINSGIKGIEEIKLQVGKPIKSMLALKAKNIEEGLKSIGNNAIFEYKYDGFRVQIHKDNEKIQIFTRGLEEVTTQFPDIVQTVKEKIKTKKVILDGEAVGFDPNTKDYLPFQAISQRIRRKYEIERMVKQLPVEIILYDIMLQDDEELLNLPLSKRREILYSIIDTTEYKIRMSNGIITHSVEDAQAFFLKAKEEGEEGLMLKDLNSIYKPGSRVGNWLKLKHTMETLDLAITKATWGEGKRANFLSSFTLSCLDKNNNFLEIGKVGTGIKEEITEELSFHNLTELLKPHIINENNREVEFKPKIIVEIAFEEIQKSKKSKSGYSLRFPRMIRLRTDKQPEETSTLEQIEDLFYDQIKIND